MASLSRTTYVIIGLLALFGAFSIIAPRAEASHRWGPYHWARTSNPFLLQLGDNLNSTWDPYLSTTSSDWSLSSVLDTTVVTGMTAPKTCKPVLGRVEVCNSKYGRNGWLGIAQIWVNGDHITQGAVKLNDTYFNTSTYNNPAWRNLVMCQEVGHTFGLNHQDVNFNNANLGTCMDYTSDPATNQHPNQHDYDLLEEIYAHLDSSTTVASASAQSNADVDSDDPREWGREISRSRNGQISVYELDLGNGQKILRHVFWVEANSHEHGDE